MNRSTRTDITDAPLDPKVAAELEALDAAPRGEAIDDDALASLVRDVRAQAPVMPTELRQQLRESVAAGFPRGGAAGAFRRVLGRRAAASSPKRRRRSFAFGGGMAVTAVLAVFVVGVALTQDTNKSLTLSGSDAMKASQAVEQTELSNRMSAEGPDATPPTGNAGAGSGLQSFSTEQGNAYERKIEATASAGLPRGADGVPPVKSTTVTPQSATKQLTKREREPSVLNLSASSASAGLQAKTSTPASGKRRVEQAVDLSVRVKSGELDEASGKVGDITRGAGGYVADSQVAMRTRGAGTATFTLQVASSKLDQAIDRLSDLGTVTRQNQTSTDITSAFNSSQQRLNDARAVRKALLRSLDKADSAGEIASLRARIADNRRTIAGLESQRLQLERRTNLTTISLALRAPSSGAADAEDDGRWSIGDAADDAVSILGAVSGVLLVGAAALLPFAILIAIAWAVHRVRRRRQRDAALDD